MPRKNALRLNRPCATPATATWSLVTGISQTGNTAQSLGQAAPYSYVLSAKFFEVVCLGVIHNMKRAPRSTNAFAPGARSFFHFPLNCFSPTYLLWCSHTLLPASSRLRGNTLEGSTPAVSSGETAVSLSRWRQRHCGTACHCPYPS